MSFSFQNWATQALLHTVNEFYHGPFCNEPFQLMIRDFKSNLHQDISTYVKYFQQIFLLIYLIYLQEMHFKIYHKLLFSLDLWTTFLETRFWKYVHGFFLPTYNTVQSNITTTSIPNISCNYFCKLMQIYHYSINHKTSYHFSQSKHDVNSQTARICASVFALFGL